MSHWSMDKLQHQEGIISGFQGDSVHDIQENMLNNFDVRFFVETKDHSEPKSRKDEIKLLTYVNQTSKHTASWYWFPQMVACMQNVS